jgi:hypothetical protein
LNTLELIKNSFDKGKESFKDIDEAILLANAIVEINPFAKKGSPNYHKIEEIRVELLQKSLDYMAEPIHGSHKHAD